MKKPKIPSNLKDAHDILIMKCAATLADGRIGWIKNVRRLIHLLEVYNPALSYQYEDVKKLYEPKNRSR